MKTLALLFLFLLVGCVPPSSCEPLTAASCACSADGGGSLTGARYCNREGTAYGACQCGERCDGTADVRRCACGTLAGLAYCSNEVGSVWSACDCTSDAGH